MNETIVVDSGVKEFVSKESITIKSLFSAKIPLRIPPYQRAYSWEKKHCSQFLQDLKDQQGKQYYLGQLLFEKEDDALLIIDGQQRVTTVVLLMAALAKVNTERNEDITHIKSTFLSDVFRTIEDDQLRFKKTTRDFQVIGREQVDTLSQARLISAFKLFYADLAQLTSQELGSIQDTLEMAIISTFFISSKIEATQVFEYQNNRGKELSRFEVIKAFLMNQVYLNSQNNSIATRAIDEIQRIISQTYRHIESVEGYFTENELLDYLCSLHYGSNGTIDSIKAQLSKADNKPEWIHAFFEGMQELTHCARTLVTRSHHEGVLNLFLVGDEVNWKILLLAIFHRDTADGREFDILLKLLEVLSFKMKLGDFRSDHLPGFAREYFQSSDPKALASLVEKVKHVADHGFLWYWNADDRFVNIISNYFEEGTYHYDLRTIKYVLWQYENELRKQHRSGALLDRNLFNDYTIEHICPQKPSNYDHSEEFQQNYLHLAGNLSLLTQSQNSKFGNKSFEKKKELFQNTALTSYKEIREKDQWKELEITERHRRIAVFAKRYFDTSQF